MAIVHDHLPVNVLGRHLVDTAAGVGTVFVPREIEASVRRLPQGGWVARWRDGQTTLLTSHRSYLPSHRARHGLAAVSG